MAKEVAYVPLAQAPTGEVIAPTKIDIPTYPDKGVSYAGFSKTLLGQNQYKLNPQNLFDYNIRIVATGGETGFSLTLSTESDKNHYISGVYIGGYPNAVSRIRLSDTSNGKVFWYDIFSGGGTIQSKGFQFKEPIEIKGNGVTLTLTAAAAASDEYIVNLFGFYE